MFPRFEVAGFAITVIVFILMSQLKAPFQNADTTILQYGVEQLSNPRTDDVVEPNPYEDLTVEELFTELPVEEVPVEEEAVLGALTDAMNSTLGFGKVFMISMPDRSDKRDAFSLQARISNITFDVRDGVAGADVPARALPLNFAQDPGATGCWRAHLNVMQEMVRDNIQSALVFEDDADWDVAIKYQTLQAARATRFLTSQPEEGGSISPYGADWDIIWFGHCAASTDPDDDRRFVVTDDPTVLPPWSRSEFFKPDMSLWEEDNDDYLNLWTRIYFKSSWNSCTAAYAISLRGAEKVIFTESMVPFNDPVDNGMGAMCNQHILDFSCIAPFPTVIGISKPAGASNRGSDIRGLDNEQIAEEGWSERLMFSTRQNIPRILTGSEKFVSTFGNETMPLMSLEDIGKGVGHGEWVWNGVRYSDLSEYQMARDVEMTGNEYQAVYEGQAEALEDWQNPLAAEVVDAAQEGESEVALAPEVRNETLTESQPSSQVSIEAEQSAFETATEVRQGEPERPMVGHTPELLEAQPQ